MSVSSSLFFLSAYVFYCIICRFDCRGTCKSYGKLTECNYMKLVNVWNLLVHYSHTQVAMEVYLYLIFVIP